MGKIKGAEIAMKSGCLPTHGLLPLLILSFLKRRRYLFLLLGASHSAVIIEVCTQCALQSLLLCHKSPGLADLTVGGLCLSPSSSCDNRSAFILPEFSFLISKVE